MMLVTMRLGPSSRWPGGPAAPAEAVGSLAPHRRGPGLFEDSLHPEGAGGGSAHHQRPQDWRHEGVRCPLSPQGPSGGSPDPGGGQERGLRSGTEATPQIAALAAAASLGRERMEEHTAALTDLKAYALETFQRGVPGLRCLPRGRAPHLRHLPAGVSQPGGGALAQ